MLQALPCMIELHNLQRLIPLSYSLNKSKSEDVKKTLGSSEGERMKRKRKSRWGKVSCMAALIHPVYPPSLKELTEDERAVAVASATFSTATFNKPQLTAEQQQQLREQQAVMIMFSYHFGHFCVCKDDSHCQSDALFWTKATTK